MTRPSTETKSKAPGARSRLRHVLVATLALAASHGCSEGGDTADVGGAHDLLQAPDRSLVEAFRLGGEEPIEAEMFDSWPRFVVDGAGHLHVLNRRQGRVAVFDEEGVFLRWIGEGAGRGPGEFNDPVRLGLLGDTLWIRNLQPPHITLFGADGTLLGVDPVPVRAPEGMVSGVQGLSGYLAGGRAWVEPDRSPDPLEEGRIPRSSLEVGTRRVEEARDTVLTWRSNRNRLRGLAFGPVPEPPFFAVAADGSAVVIAEWSDDRPDRLALRILDPDGSTRWEEALTVAPERIPASEHREIVREGRGSVEALREQLLGLGVAGAPAVPSEAEAREALYLPTHRPPVRAVSLGVDETIWLQLESPGPAESWVALSMDEGVLFRVELPEDARLGQATRDAIWYAETDEVGVVRIVRAEIVDVGGARRPE